MTVETLGHLVQSYVPAAQLVEARILRRVIRLDRRLPGFGLSVLRRQSYTIERERLLTFVDRTELDLSSIEDLPRNVILLARPNDDELQSPAGVERVLKRYARLLLHECVHVELDQPSVDETSRSGWARERRRELGELEFAEIRAVLQKEELLFPAPSDVETYIEFVATYLELRYFVEAAVPRYFPAIRDWRAVDRIVSQDLDHAALFAKLQFLSTPDLEAISAEQVNPAAQATQRWAATPRITLADFRRLQARAERAAAIGNRVNAAIVHTRAAHLAPLEYAAEAHAAAHGEIVQVAQRLQQVLSKTAVPAEVWATALQPLLAPAAVGFWANEARLLYDLQKVCIEHERGVYRLDLVEWIRTMGTRPIRRPLPLLRDALMIRHLRTALRRVTKACIGPDDREALTVLLSQAVEQIEHESRDQLRPIVAGVLQDVGLVPQNVPERVAQRKLIEELLDRVVERSYVSMADLRDALSKNELKLPDVATVADLAQGDRLLRADRKFDTALDGVYRRGAIYQRWPQTISSLAFGTELGRFLTKYLALPYGGAYLALAFVHHVVLMIAGDGHHAPELTPPELTPHDAAAHAVGPVFYVGVLALGTWLLALIHLPSFREWTIEVLAAAWRITRQVVIDWPAKLLHSQIVQLILNSQAFAALRNYLLRPGFVTALICGGLYLVGQHNSQRLTLEIFLATALFLNSPIGRYATELSSDFLVRAFQELKLRVFAAAFQWIMAIFHGLLVMLERIVYMVDEWLLFRSGDNQLLHAIKLVGGVVWFFVAYVVVFAFTLLIEPQINPIKHFPVVTVAHKIILPTWPVFVKQLTPYLGTASANWLVGTTIWLIPGVFGFLVWELKENWRLYAANRARKLSTAVIGQHGETMVRLLRPGFHSGTLPKAFAALRRAVRKAEHQGDANVITNREAVITHVAEAVRRFVERELLALLKEAGLRNSIRVGAIHSATNRIDVELHQSGAPTAQAVVLTWEEDQGTLAGLISQRGWLDDLSPDDRDAFAMALRGLFQRSDVDEVRGSFVIALTPPIAWADWVAYWSELPGTAVEHPPSPRTTNAMNRWIEKILAKPRRD